MVALVRADADVAEAVADVAIYDVNGDDAEVCNGGDVPCDGDGSVDIDAEVDREADAADVPV